MKVNKKNYSSIWEEDGVIKIIDQTRIYFPDSYFGLSIVSKCYKSNPNKYITDSQKKASKLRNSVFIAADSDAIYGRKYRYDGCHFNLKGAQKLGKEYRTSFMKNIFKY